MALKRTITISANGNAYTLSDDAGVIFYQGSTASTECYYANNSLTLQNIYTGKEVIQSALFSDIINASTGLAFTSLANLQTYLASNFFRKATGGGGNQLATPVVTVGTPTNTTVPLSLVAIPNATQYIWQRATNVGFTTGVTTLAGTGTSITDTGLSGSTTYYYRAAATALGVGYTNSSYSTVVSATTAALPTIAKPTIVTGTSTLTTIPLTWGFQTGATTATIRQSMSSDMAAAITISTNNTGTSFTATGLTEGTSYYFDMVQNGAGYNQSPYSEVQVAVTAALVPLIGVDKQGPPIQNGNIYTNNTVVGGDQYFWSNVQIPDESAEFIIQADIVNQYGTFNNGHIGVYTSPTNINNALAYINFWNTDTNKGKLSGQNYNSIYFNDPEVTLTAPSKMRVRGDATHIYFEVNYGTGDGWVASATAPVVTRVTGMYLVAALYTFLGTDILSNVLVYPNLNGFSPPAPDPTGLTAQELRYDNVQQAKSSLKYSDFATAAANGDPVGVVLDKKGYLPLVYAGIASPTITHTPPTLIDTLWLQFNNEPLVNYNSNTFTAAPAPFEVVVVSRDLYGQRFEAKMENGSNAAYLGNAGTDTRVFDQNGVITGSGSADKYKPVIERLVVRTTGIEYWRNSVKLGTYVITGLTSPEIIAATTKTIHSIGTFTNCMDFDFGSLYFKATPFSDSEWTTNIYPDFATKWGVGVYPNQILLSDMKWDRSGTTYTPSATVVNTPAGVTVAAASTWDYEWYWISAQSGLTTQTKFATTYQVTQADFPNNGGVAGQTHVEIKVRMRPKSTLGATWRYLSGTFADYTGTNS